MLSHRNENENSEAKQSYTNVHTNERYILFRGMVLKLSKGGITSREIPKILKCNKKTNRKVIYRAI